MVRVREAPSRERRVSSASGTWAKRSVSRSLSGDGPDGTGGRGPEGGGGGTEDAEFERNRMGAGRLAIAVVGDRGGPPRAETVKFEAWDAIELVRWWLVEETWEREYEPSSVSAKPSIVLSEYTESRLYRYG